MRYIFNCQQWEIYNSCKKVCRVIVEQTLNEKLLKENLDEGVTSDKSRPSSRCRGPATSTNSCIPYQIVRIHLETTLELDYSKNPCYGYKHVNRQRYNFHDNSGAFKLDIKCCKNLETLRQTSFEFVTNVFRPIWGACASSTGTSLVRKTFTTRISK